ncbi:MAG TPA: P-loop NTPase fold protein [Acidobacteriota bacterium]|nr:P-loop NTPase fold protein [Acidobacteriota bacterium]
MGENQEEKEVRFLADVPLESLDDDLLGWGRLADNVVDALLLNSGKKGYVVGIKGSWGSGKTTFLNFVRLIFDKLSTEKGIIVFRYNPWLYANECQLPNFFTELGKVIWWQTAEGKQKVAGELAGRLEKYALYARSLEGTGVGLTPVGEKLSRVRRLFEMMAMWLRKRAGQNGRPLLELKKEIQKRLDDLAKTVVVLIDDVDRLPPQDICDVFQVVKNNGDFRGLSYVLAYDEAVVRAALKREYCQEYESFIEKIVQIEFALPPPDRVVLGEYFTSTLDTVLERLPATAEQYWSEQRWSNCYLQYIRHFVTSFRDVKRIVNGICLNANLVCRDNTVEVNPLDFVAVETISVCFPDVYDFIRRNKGIFVYVDDPTDPFGVPRKEDKLARKALDDTLDRVETKYRPLLDGLLRDLFPQLQHCDDDWSPDTASEQEWLRDLRVCSAKIFDRYFLYANYVGDIPNADVQFLIANLGHVSGCRTAVESLAKYYYTPGLRRLLEHLEAAMPMVVSAGTNPSNIVAFLFDVSDYLPRDEGVMGGIPIRFWLTNLVTQLVAGSSDEARAYLLQQAFAQSEGVFGPLAVFAVAAVEAEKQTGQQALAPANSQGILCRQAAERALAWMKAGAPLEHRHLVFILRVAKDFSEPKEFEFSLRGMLEDDINFQRFVTRYLVRSESVAIGQIAGKVDYRYDFPALEYITDLGAIRRRMRTTLLAPDAPDEVKLAFDVFLRDFDRYVHDPKPWKRTRL